MKENGVLYNKPVIAQAITNIASITLLLSGVFVLGVLCRFLKQCWQKIRGRRKHRKHDVIAFHPIRATPPVRLRKCSSTNDMDRLLEPSVLQDSGIPANVGEVFVQPAEETRASLGRAMSVDTVRSLERSKQLAASGWVTPPRLPKQQHYLTWNTRRHTAATLQLKPSLYKREYSMKLYHAKRDKKCGTIEVEIYFNAGISKLEVKVLNTHQLPIKGHIPAMNIYVTIKVLPERDFKCTSVHTHSINPDFNDHFVFPVRQTDDVSSHVLLFEVYHMDRFSISYPQASATLPLFQVDVGVRRRLEIPLVEPQRSFLGTFHPAYHSTVTGTLLVCLEYQPENNMIIVNPVEVRNVPKKKYGSYDKTVYIKVVLRHHGTKLLKRKTQAREMKRISRSCHFYCATFDEPLEVQIDSIGVEESDITISLNHYLFLKSSFIIGHVRISKNEQGYEASHLQAIIDSPNEQISAWYEIRGFTISGSSDYRSASVPGSLLANGE